jgi:Zn-dependent metalloprotease/PKD repeat protein
MFDLTHYLRLSWLFFLAYCLLPFEVAFAQPQSQGWLDVERLAMPAQTLVLTQKKLLGMGVNDDLRPTRIAQTDDLGYTHHRYQQIFKGIAVENAVLLVHERNGMAYLANGNVLRNLQGDATPNLAPEQALQRALAHIGATKYAWQDPQYEAIIKEIENKPEATYYPSGELVWVAPTLTNNDAQTYRLAYKFDVYAIAPLKRAYIYIDAQDGKLVAEQNQLHDVDIAATGNDAYSCSNPVNITADNVGSFYRLRETQRGGGIETYTAMNSDSYPLFDITDTDTYFNSDPTAVSAHRCTEATYDYFKNTFNRNSIDGNGYKLKSWVHYGVNMQNAYWNGTFMTYGDGGAFFSPLTSPDVVAHEIAHGLTQFEANLVYAYEPGALNESFSDIFGTVIEHQANPSCADWIIGSDIALTANGLRSMSNPNDATMLTRCPDTYGGTHWINNSSDYGGVHTNSGVQNFWFYLLSNGGSGTNDNNTPYTVTGIGMDKAARIAYRNLTVYLTPTSQYLNARAGAIQAATDLYGANSNEVAQVTAAWCAVGVGNCTAANNSLTLTAPNGGEIWQYGSTQNITWTTTGIVPTVNIDYSIDGGATWNNIAANVSNTGNMAWEVPNASSSQAKMRVSAALNAGLQDMSDATFTIQGCDVVASFNTPTNICPNIAQTFTNTSGGTGALTYTWQIDGINVGNTPNLDYTFANAGNFTVALTVSNGACSDTYTRTMLVNPTADASFTHTESDLTANVYAAQNGATTYNWDFGDGGTATTQNAVHTYGAAGTYNVCLTVENECGSVSGCVYVQASAILSNENYIKYSTTLINYCNNGLLSDVCQVTNNGYLNIGTLNVDGALIGHPEIKKEKDNIYLLKLNNNGSKEIAKIFGNNDKNYRAISIKNVDNGAIIIGNVTDSISNNIFIMKINSGHETLWIKQYDLNYLPTNIIVLDNGDFIITTRGYYDINESCIFSVDANGSLLWTKAISNAEIYSISNIENNNLFFVGANYSYGLVGKIDLNGNILWIKASNELLTNVTVDYYDNDKLFVVGNNFNAGNLGIVMQSLDQSGNIIWTKQINNMFGEGVIKEEDGFILKTFYSGSVHLLKINFNGDVLWCKKYNHNGISLNGTFYQQEALVKGIGNGYFLLAQEGGTAAHGYFIKTDEYGSVGCWTDTLLINSSNYTINYSTIVLPEILLNDINTQQLTLNSVVVNNYINNNIECENYACLTLKTSFNYMAANYCSTSPYTFTNTSTGATAYQWLVNGTPTSTATNLTHTFPTQGTYTITLEASNGTCTDTYIQTITVSGSATQLNLGDDILQCNNGSSITIDCGISSALWYNWDFNGTLVGTTQSITTTQSGTYYLSVMDACNQVGVDSISVLLDDNCVWSGDFNYDGIANNYDLLHWGWASGHSGAVRPNASYTWQAQPCSDWANTQQDGTNYKHADGNGNGIIDNNDPQAIISNYGQTHGIAPAVNNTASPLSITAVVNQMPTAIGNNTLLYIDLYLNNNDNASTTLYGAAFKVDYLFPSAFHIHNATINFNGSWLGSDGVNMRSVQKNFINSNDNGGYIEVAVSRNDHQNATGSSKVATLIAEIDVVNSGGAMQAFVSATNAQVSLANGNIMGISNSSNMSFSLSPSTAPTGLVLQPTVWLNGAYNVATSQMKTTLRSNNLLPLQQPYNISPYNYSGTEIFANIANMPSNAVDWVLVELRSASNIQQNVVRKAALLLSNGSVVDIDGVTNGLRFPTVAAGNYYVVIRHRNHIDIVSNNTVNLSNGIISSLDLGNASNVMGGVAQVTALANGKYALKGGDFDHNGIINVSDFNLFRSQAATINQYNAADCNFDGNVTTNDFNVYMLNPAAIGVSAIRY